MDQQNFLNQIGSAPFGRSTPLVRALQRAMILYLMVWSISPPLSLDTIYRLLALVCAFGWFALTLLSGFPLQRIHLYAVGFMILVMLVAVVQSRGFSGVMRPIAYYMLVIAFLMNYAYQERWNELRFMTPIVLVLLIIFNVITIRTLAITPEIAREIVRNDEKIYSYLRQGVGGYALIYSQVLLIPILFVWTRRAFRKRKILCVMGAAWLASILVLIFQAGYTIAIVTAFISILMLFGYRFKSVFPALLLALTILIGFVLLIGYVAPVREFLLKIFDGTKVAKKVHDIYLSVTTDTVADSINARITRYKDSVQTIFGYPLIGGLWLRSGGGHSALLDSFAKYGIYGGVLFVKMFYSVPLRIKQKTKKKQDIRLANALLVGMILFTLLDSCSYEFMLPVLIILPLLYEDIQKWRNEYEGSLDRESDPR